MQQKLSSDQIEALRLKLTIPAAALSTQEAAFILGKSVAAMVSDRNRGRGPRYVKAGGPNQQAHCRYVVADLLAYLSGGAAQAQGADGHAA